MNIFPVRRHLPAYSKNNVEMRTIEECRKKWELLRGIKDLIQRNPSASEWFQIRETRVDNCSQTSVALTEAGALQAAPILFIPDDGDEEDTIEKVYQVGRSLFGRDLAVVAEKLIGLIIDGMPTHVNGPNNREVILRNCQRRA